ncbi:MAG: CHAT domain-containing protein [Cyanobacteria bacterium P01_D01_bin.2]
MDNYLEGVRSSANAREGAELVPPEVLIANAHTDILNQAITNGKRLSALETKESLSDAELDELVTLQTERREILQAFNNFKDNEFVQEQLALLSPAETRQNVPLEELTALQDNLAQIPQGAVLLYPFILEDRLELVVTSPYAPPIRRTVNVSRTDLNDAVQAFRYALDSPARDAITPAKQLYDWLIGPIQADLEAAGVNTIIYAPDRTLRYIPLAALHDGENWLTESYRINHITAASLTDLNTLPSRNDPKILAGALTDPAVTIDVGDSSYNFPHLQYVDDEVNAIAALSPDATPLLDTDFNRARIERDVNRHTILHLATHAKFLVGQPEDSFILFNNKERWTLRDFKEGLLSLTRVDLVVLSACETGVDNTFGNGEEILGFGYLMQNAGARAAMASLWAVDDGGTQILMKEFYEALVKGNLSKTEALRQAQLALININESRDRGSLVLADSIDLDPSDLSHPYYWAPFILIGNGL